jgi:hypothetical protein
VRYFTAIVIPIGFVVAVFSALAVLTWLADGWSPGAQDVVTEVVVWWAHYWWMIAMVLGSGCLIWATVSDAMAPSKRKPRG